MTTDPLLIAVIAATIFRLSFGGDPESPAQHAIKHLVCDTLQFGTISALLYQNGHPVAALCNLFVTVGFVNTVDFVSHFVVRNTKVHKLATFFNLFLYAFLATSWLALPQSLTADMLIVDTTGAIFAAIANLKRSDVLLDSDVTNLLRNPWFRGPDAIENRAYLLGALLATGLTWTRSPGVFLAMSYAGALV